MSFHTLCLVILIPFMSCHKNDYTGFKIQISAIPNDSHYNMIDLILDLDQSNKNQLLRVIRCLIENLDLFPKTQH